MNQRANVLSYDVVFEEPPEGGFTVTVPALPGCISEGDSFEEAKKYKRGNETLFRIFIRSKLKNIC